MKHSNSSNSSKNRMSGEAMYYEYPRVNFYPESDLKKLLIELFPAVGLQSWGTSSALRCFAFVPVTRTQVVG